MFQLRFTAIHSLCYSLCDSPQRTAVFGVLLCVESDSLRLMRIVPIIFLGPIFASASLLRIHTQNPDSVCHSLLKD